MAIESKAFNILIIDDSPDDRDYYRRILTRSTSCSYSIIDADNGKAGIAAAIERDIDCILLDFNLPDMDGLQILEALSRDLSTECPPVILLTGGGSERVAVQAMKAGAREYLVKDNVTPDDLLHAVQSALENAVLQEKLEQAYAELEKKNARLHAMTETALRFVDDVAHEFRTPLAVIHEFTALIHDGIGGPVTDRQKEFLNYTTSATRDLAQMVDDFLDSSRLKHRALRVDRKPYRVEALFDHVRPLIQSRAQSNGITIDEQIASNLPEVFGDIEKAGRTLVNLAVNAVKFSPQDGTIELVANADGSDVAISVIDHGTGIHPGDLEIITSRFGQVGQGQTNKVKGFGLGLNIAFELAWLNLGKLNVESQLNEGSTFSFTLPQFDPHHIVDRHITSITSRDPAAVVSVLHVTPNKPRADIEQLRAFLASICFPMDLILTTPSEQSAVLIGATAEPRDWIEKLQAAWKAASESTLRPGAFSIQWRGTYQHEQLTDSFGPLVMSHIEEARACA